MITKFDITQFMLEELKRRDQNLEEETLFMEFHKRLCNQVLYSDPKFKESTIILTHIFQNLMSDFMKEVHMRVNGKGVYQDEQL